MITEPIWGFLKIYMKVTKEAHRPKLVWPWIHDGSAVLVCSLLLTLKMPRKSASENDVCLCRLLANFSNLFLHTGKQCGEGGWVVRRCHVSFVTGASSWYWLIVGQGLLYLYQVRVGRWCFYFFCFFTFIPVPLSSLSFSFISFAISSVSFLPFSGRRHKMTHKGWRVVKPQLNQSKQCGSWSDCSYIYIYRWQSRRQLLWLAV